MCINPQLKLFDYFLENKITQLLKGDMKMDKDIVGFGPIM